MNSITLTDNHLLTLAELNKIAGEHDCYITLGHRVESSEELEDEKIEEILGFEEDESDISSELFEKYFVERSSALVSSYWFELHQVNRGCLGTMVASSISSHIEMSVSGLGFISNELRDWIYENMNDWHGDERNPIFDKDKEDETLTGVFKDKTVNCYREGICVREFADLVCDYFGVPRIERCY